MIVVHVLAYMISCFTLEWICVLFVLLFLNIDAISKVNKDYHNFETRRQRRCFHSTTVIHWPVNTTSA